MPDASPERKRKPSTPYRRANRYQSLIDDRACRAHYLGCRRLREIVGELVRAIKLATPLKTLADVIHPFPAFQPMLGESLNQLASNVATEGEHHGQYARQL